MTSAPARARVPARPGRPPVPGSVPWPRRLTTPRWLARLVALLGLVSLGSALVPAWRGRLHLLAEVVPPVAPAAATAGTAAVGLLLVVLAHGLRRRKRRAWELTALLAAAAVVLHLVKGLDVEEALLAAAVLGLLVLGRRHFVAAPGPRSGRATAAVALAVAVAATALGYALLAAVDGRQAPTTTAGQRLVQAALGLIGVAGPVRFTTAEAASDAAVALLVVGGAGLLTVLAVALRPPGGPHRLSAAEEAGLRAVIDRHGPVDSLAYFALRRDRSVVFSPSGKAAVSYRVVGGVSLAAGDPVGDPEAWPGAIRAWLAQARAFGWIPAVLGAGERAATAYAREGLDALELGDEAVVRVSGFGLDGRSMRGVRQAVARTRRAGYRVRCDRVEQLSAEEVRVARAAADAWRGGPVERGFSMALGRLGDPADGGCVLVRVTDPAGTLRGLLHLVPWGADGLSLDLMRRAPDAENGTMEAMVTGLLAECRRLGVGRVSLNFAVFRSVFARGDRLGAGPVLRLEYAVLQRASRVWQLESLYRANAKYQPEWVPRFLCFDRVGDLTAVGVAALRAEAFLAAPAWVRQLRWAGRRGSGEVTAG
jgi:lysyl-tRNA synthetase, class II